MLSLNASVNPLQNTHIGTVVSGGSVGGQQGTQQSLKDVIDKLAQALTKDGHLDQDSPLGKMVGEQMKKMNPLAAALGGDSADGIKAALGEVIKDKLGDNFGAAADFGLGGGTSGGAGKSDLMSQVLNGLGKASLDDLLSKQGDGTKFSSSDMPLLDKVAQFMDQNPSKFPAPDSGSWKNELKEDNYLDKSETSAFRAALDMLGGQLDQQQSGVSDAGTAGGTLGGDAVGGNELSDDALSTDPSGGQSALSGNPAQDLGQLLSGLLQQGLNASVGNGGGNSVGGGLGTPINDPSQQSTSGNSVTQDLGQLLSGLIEKGLQASQNGGAAGGGAAGGGGVGAAGAAGGQHNPLFAQHDLQNSLSQAANAIVQALTGSSTTSLS
ncbi:MULTISPECIES: type III secretion protein HrpZ [unclassified Pseudomonas]|uniref:type III secretion protein HrpZ n=1 Tax=unclassified Pseudomonas TaxID=196821 RepID=UPI0025D29886|nr:MULTISPECIES: type III secretion protein HrpZ [unclassified Pseudomonas]